jgi:hypothetical protein
MSLCDLNPRCKYKKNNNTLSSKNEKAPFGQGASSLVAAN